MKKICRDIDFFMQTKKTISFEVHGAPIGKGRPRFSRAGHTYTPQKTRDYERHIAQAAFTAMCEADEMICDRPVVVEILAEMPIPASWSKKRQIAAEAGAERPKRPDIDNIAKAALDACNGVVYGDDAQVHALSVRKVYGSIGSGGRLSVSISWTYDQSGP